MTITAAPVKAVITIGTGGLLAAQVVPVAGSLDSVGRLSLDGALIIAVGVLWRFVVSLMAASDAKVAEKDAQLAKKDDLIVAMTTRVTEVMVEVMAAVKEARKSSDEIGAALDNMAENFAAVQVLLQAQTGWEPKPREPRDANGKGKG